MSRSLLDKIDALLNVFGAIAILFMAFALIACAVLEVAEFLFHSTAVFLGAGG